MEIYGLGTDVSAVESVEHDEASTWNGRDVKKASDSGNIHHIVFGNMTPAQDANIIKTSGSISVEGAQDKHGNKSVGAEIEVRSDDNTCSGSVHSEVHQSADGNVGGKASAEVTIQDNEGFSVTISGTVEQDTNGRDNAEVKIRMKQDF